jgi:hypothetical protein
VAGVEACMEYTARRRLTRHARAGGGSPGLSGVSLGACQRQAVYMCAHVHGQRQTADGGRVG